jgi:hypothetical protein
VRCATATWRLAQRTAYEESSVFYRVRVQLVRRFFRPAKFLARSGEAMGGANDRAGIGLLIYHGTLRSHDGR